MVLLAIGTTLLSNGQEIKQFSNLSSVENKTISQLFSSLHQAQEFVSQMNNAEGIAKIEKINFSNGTFKLESVSNKLELKNIIMSEKSIIDFIATNEIDLLESTLIPNKEGDVALITKKELIEKSQRAVETSSTFLYPNPTKDDLTIKLSSSYSNGAILYIYDSKGALVMEQVIKDTPKIIDTVALPVGVYMATLVSEDNRETIRFVKE
ncbi:putative secreted protein (Por secretion system target) [Flavobacterium branchiophilum]|uniref:Putative secreted protein (Por secretion system target) n=2 Tax=Flavobacterium branchiophilum TaxID=55197 RepID=A0A543G0V4_9FLAO|nr:putative secreted protein (Por secretion system target) [Flavobacterium branchiophilum]